MPFSPERKTYDETKKRASSDYVKFTPDYRIVLRMLNKEARVVYQHWIKEANGGKGLSITCPGLKVCPIDLEIAHLDKEDPQRLDVIAKRRFFVNVLERTPYTTCKSCGNYVPGKKCASCKADLKGSDFAPLNKVKILAQGPRLFNEVLNGIEKGQLDDLGAEITEYDITFTTVGELRNRRITALPQPVVPLDSSWLIDSETGDSQKLYDLDQLVEPATIEEIEAYRRGASIEEVNKIKGIS